MYVLSRHYDDHVASPLLGELGAAATNADSLRRGFITHTPSFTGAHRPKIYTPDSVCATGRTDILSTS